MRWILRILIRREEKLFCSPRILSIPNTHARRRLCADPHPIFGAHHCDMHSTRPSSSQCVRCHHDLLPTRRRSSTHLICRELGPYLCMCSNQKSSTHATTRKWPKRIEFSHATNLNMCNDLRDTTTPNIEHTRERTSIQWWLDSLMPFVRAWCTHAIIIEFSEMENATESVSTQRPSVSSCALIFRMFEDVANNNSLKLFHLFDLSWLWLK